MNQSTVTFTLQSLEAYKKEFNEDVDISVSNIREKSMLVSSIRSKWLMYLFKEKENLDKICQKRKQILDEKLKESGKDVSMIRIKKEELAAKSSAAIKMLDEYEKNTRTCIDYIEYCMNILNDFNFQIKNAVDLLKLERL